MRSYAHQVGLAQQRTEIVVELINDRHSELVHEQTRGMRRDSNDWRVVNLALQIEVPGEQTAVRRPSTAKPRRVPFKATVLLPTE